MTQNSNVQRQDETTDGVIKLKNKRTYTPNVATGRLPTIALNIPEKEPIGRRGMSPTERVTILGIAEMPVSFTNGIKCTPESMSAVGLVTKYQQEHLKSDIYHYGKLAKKVFTIRSIEGGYGVWRVK